MAARWLLFTKTLRDLETDEMADAIADLAFDGADLLIRDGAQVTPANVRHELPEAAEALRAAGLSVPAAACDVTRPDDPYAEDIFTACAGEGIELLRLGFYGYDPALGFEASMRQARESLRGLAELGRRHGVKPMLQLHGGNKLNCSGALALQLVEGIAPEDLGIYTDPGNMVAQEGAEPWAMHLDMLGEYLCYVGVKNLRWIHQEGRWRVRWVGLDDGLIRWDDIFRLLRERGYDGPLSLHSFYDYLSPNQVIEQTREDLAYARTCWGEERG